MLSWWLPENVSTFGAEVDGLFGLIHAIVMVTWVLVTVALLSFVVLYRYRPERRATYTHGNTALEIAWTIVPTLILVLLGFLSINTWDRIKIDIPESDYAVRVTGKQFNWEMLYPGPDGKFDTDDDKMLENDLTVPVNEPIRVHLEAKDVIHSFFVPQLRLKQDAMPGRTIDLWFEATKTGRYEIPCAELCGFGHSGMLGFLTVVTAEEYQAWTKEQWGDGAVAATAATKERRS